MECAKYVIRWKDSNYKLYLVPYKAFDKPTIDSYYLVSNWVYHTLGRCDEHINLKKVLYDLGVCDIGKNTLCYNKEYGSRFYIGIESTDEAATEKRDRVPLCTACNACMKACPTKAITDNGFIAEKCLRYQMEQGRYEDETLAGGRVLGCDICQRVCHLNKHEYIKNYEIFSLHNLQKLIDNNDMKELKQLIGNNMARVSKLRYLVDVATKNTLKKGAEHE